MAKFPSVSARATASRGTFIQRSREISSAEKATFHTLTGAGRSRVIRKFFGASDADVTEVLQVLERALVQRLGLS